MRQNEIVKECTYVVVTHICDKNFFINLLFINKCKMVGSLIQIVHRCKISLNNTNCTFYQPFRIWKWWERFRKYQEYYWARGCWRLFAPPPCSLCPWYLLNLIIYIIYFFRYKDILQGDFFEDYFLLAYKSLTWLHWSRQSCSQVHILDRAVYRFI